MDRIIGSYTGPETGALVIAIGALHGNEPAGVGAIQTVLQLLEAEPRHNAGFRFCGRLVGLVGNLHGFSQEKRYQHADLNRLWSEIQRQRIQQLPLEDKQAEDLEMAELEAAIVNEIRDYLPKALVLIDLHTTSAEDGVFCIPADTPSSIRLARELHAPVVLGMMHGIGGTLVQYISENRIQVEGHPEHSVAVAFEAGQHRDPLSEQRAVAALINCLRGAGCVRPEDVDGRHDAVLRRFSAGLPKVTSLVHIHRIQPADNFRMQPGYRNFQPVAKDEHLADDVRGPVLSPVSGRILLPLYQSQGNDGFFIVRDFDGQMF